MGKIVLLLIMLGQFIQGNDQVNASVLQNNCFNCHQQYKIPNKLIYQRYLAKYSTEDRMKNAIYYYLKNPKIKNTIMPPEFFSKFPLKKPLILDGEMLRKSIDAYLTFFNVKKKLTLNHK